MIFYYEYDDDEEDMLKHSYETFSGNEISEILFKLNIFAQNSLGFTIQTKHAK